MNKLSEMCETWEDGFKILVIYSRDEVHINTEIHINRSYIKQYITITLSIVSTESWLSN